jgi:hypothetical protein
MAAIAQSVPGSTDWGNWTWQFLKEELAPYRGRTALVARMVVASTLMMIVSMVFRMLDEMADRIDGRAPTEPGADKWREVLNQRLHDAAAEASRELPALRAQSYDSLLREIDALTSGLATEIAAEFPG